MAKTKQPTGLSITRKDSTFTMSWKCGDKNYDDGQSLQYRTNLQGWTGVGVGKKDRSKSVTLGGDGFYPTTGKYLEWVQMRVCGNRSKYKKKGKTVNPSTSAWSYYTYNLQVPRVPSLTATMHETQSNVCTFAWSIETYATDAYWYWNAEYETMLVKESNETDGSKLLWDSSQMGWQTEVVGNDSSKVITEDTSAIADGAYTRWFRIRSRGARGASEWKYEKHVYSIPYQARVESAIATIRPAGGFQCHVIWEAPSSASHPIDKTTVEYSITPPDAGMECPDGASWTAARISADTENNDAAVFPIDRLLSADQCLFVRVNTEHDNVITYGLPVLAGGGVGVLNTPTLTSVVEGDNYAVTVNATNTSAVEDSYLVILYRPASDPTKEIVIGTIPHGSTSANVQAPDWSGETAHAFGVYAAVGDSTNITKDSALMSSAIVWGTGDVPKAPTNVSVSATDISGTIRVEWTKAWSDSDGAEISWADHEDAWESTDEPDTYDIPNIKNSRWNISGLETGIKWYVKVRLFKGSGENATFGPYSETKVIDLTSAPSVPTLVLSSAVITQSGNVTASWVYTSTDGTAQVYAEICEATITQNGITYGDVIAHTETAQHVTINAQEAGWQTGETYNLCVRVVSASGRVSDDWSAPVPVAVAEPLDVEITDTSLVEQTETIVVGGATVTRTFLALTEMPLELTLSSDDATVAVERAGSYHMDRPDETDFTGYEGETIALKKGSVESIDLDDLVGSFDDGAAYKIVVTVQDELGQKAETSLDFEVHWSHQAIVPDGSVEFDEDLYIAKVTPVAPEYAKVAHPVLADIGEYYELVDGEYVLTQDVLIDEDKTYYIAATVAETDVCDIYRLSADRPELIVKNGTFGTTYVDPYCTIGPFGGYRLVFRTANGDYITDANEIAWLDLIEDTLEADYTIIDFDGGQILLQYNVDVSSSWAKDFQETKYLGGSVQGDWNPAVNRTASVSAVTITITDEDVIEQVHRLAVSPSICHVRTKDGASYAADVQVQENYAHDKHGKIASYSFTITRVDAEGLDGMTLAEWNELHDEVE